MIGKSHNDGIEYENNSVELPTVNRGAIILEPTEAYLEWAKSCPDGDTELTLEELRKDSTVYLIPDCDYEADVENWLKRNYAAMFEYELDNWHRDERFWPEKRSFKLFKKFFNVRFRSMVIDMGKDKIVRDE
jgi:hypothetical protein